jgi:membrane fusion protein (multidrug efflux system)
MDPIYADISQSTADLLRLKTRLKDTSFNQNGKDQDKVHLFLEDNSEYPLEGKLQFSDITVDPTTGSVIMRVVFPNPEGLLLPGMFVRAVIKEGLNEKAILITQQGVSRDPKGNPYAMIVDAENKVVFRTLTLDRAIKDKWLVLAGLETGDRVIVEGLQMLRPGTVVKATPFVEKKAADVATAEKRSKGGE